MPPTKAREKKKTGISAIDGALLGNGSNENTATQPSLRSSVAGEGEMTLYTIRKQEATWFNHMFFGLLAPQGPQSRSIP